MHRGVRLQTWPVCESGTCKARTCYLDKACMDILNRSESEKKITNLKPET